MLCILYTKKIIIEHSKVKIFYNLFLSNNVFSCQCILRFIILNINIPYSSYDLNIII